MRDGTSDGLLTDPVTRTVYATDNSIYQVAPNGVLLASSADEISRFMADNFRSAAPQPIVARGAGTGTNGQSLTDGVMIEVKRRLHRLRSLDVRARTAVVEPGMVTAALNAELAPHGLFWAPHTSTLNRATVGGMISTDAAGKGSLVHGRAHRHVLALDVVLDDGTPWRAEPLPIDEAERRAAAGGRGGELWRALLDLPVTEGMDFDLPELARGFSGYGIDRLRCDGLIDPVALLCGAEGTLAVITAATIRLTPVPANTVLVVAGYDSFAAALDDAVDLAATAPTAIESFDETTLERGRSSPAWPALGEVVGERRGSVLLIEFSGGPDPDDEPDLEPLVRALAATGRSYGYRVVTDPSVRAAAWKVRADAVGLLAKVASGDARPTAMVEDCAVPVPAMPAFIAAFRAILDEFGLTYGMFGHADVGCVHVRPALDLTDPGHEAMVRTITDRVTALVAQHGGILWGEHGRGFRGDVAHSFLPAETIALMRRVKSAFDPNDLLNPGKLYRPIDHDAPLIAVDEPPLRGAHDRRIELKLRTEFADAFACNGNGLCHHYDGAEVMCPSYKVTGDPALSPKGRADLIRAWLGAEAESPATTTQELGTALVDNLDQCLSCSACSGHCPVEVDIPELKSRVLDRFYARRPRPASHRLLGRFESLAGLGRRVPGPLVRLGARAGERGLGLVDLPLPKPGPRPTDHRPHRPGTGQDVVVLPDVFTSRLEPSVLAATVDVLGRLGFDVGVARFAPSGKFDHVKGRRDRFAIAANDQADLVRSVLVDGAVPVIIEPAVALLHGREYRVVSADHPEGVRYLAEVIEQRLDRLAPVTVPRRVTLLGHCTERATAPAWVAAWSRVLEAVGHTVTTPAVGCCGMAGIFGHERANQEMSRALYDLTWAHHVDGGGGRGEPDRPTVVATGYSCRSQVARFGSAPVEHPVMLL